VGKNDIGKLEYKPIAVQNECFGGRIGSNSAEQTVLIKLMAEGKTVHYKTDAMNFPNDEELAKWIKQTKVKILSEEEFKELK
jgi:hypothetical protein